MPRRGSQYLVRKLINDQGERLGKELLKLPGLAAGSTVTWSSPLSPRHTEYRDGAALRALGISSLPLRALDRFWPSRGPVWDALGQTARKDLILVEAKAHIEEL